MKTNNTAKVARELAKAICKIRKIDAELAERMARVLSAEFGAIRQERMEEVLTPANLEFAARAGGN